MIKIFSNTIVSYLEKDVNTFIEKTGCSILGLYYNTVVVDEEVLRDCERFSVNLIN